MRLALFNVSRWKPDQSEFLRERLSPIVENDGEQYVNHFKDFVDRLEGRKERKPDAGLADSSRPAFSSLDDLDMPVPTPKVFDWLVKFVLIHYAVLFSA